MIVHVTWRTTLLMLVAMHKNVHIIWTSVGDVVYAQVITFVKITCHSCVCWSKGSVLYFFQQQPRTYTKRLRCASKCTLSGLDEDVGSCSQRSLEVCAVGESGRLRVGRRRHASRCSRRSIDVCQVGARRRLSELTFLIVCVCVCHFWVNGL